MTTKFGDFAAPVFNCRGDPYQDREKPSERDLGLAFAVPAGKRGKESSVGGHSSEAHIGGTMLLSTSSRYSMKENVMWNRQGAPVQATLHLRAMYRPEIAGAPTVVVTLEGRKLLAAAEKKKGMLTDTPFKPSQPMKLSTGMGDFYGTLGGKLEYIAESPDVKLKKGDYPEGKPNLYTSPGKKGSYGYIKTTLSERKGAGGVLGEYTYMSDPYNRAQQLAAEAKAKAPKVTDAPFVPSHPPKRGSYGYSKTNLGNKAQGTAGEYAYREQGDDGPRRDAARFETPFVPSRAPRKGYNCTMNRYPEYLADPDHIKIQARRQAKRLEMEAMAASNPWRPSHIPRQGATKSIVRMNL